MLQVALSPRRQPKRKEKTILRQCMQAAHMESGLTGHRLNGLWGNENLICSTKGNEYYSWLLWLTMRPNAFRHFHHVHQMETCEMGDLWRKRILVFIILTPYRDWQGCVLHFLTWGSGRFTRWQSLSFTSVMVLLIIRVQDTIVFRSPVSQIKNYAEKQETSR